MTCGWEGNRRSGGVALVMRHILQWFIHLQDQGLRKGDEHPAYNPHGVWNILLQYRRTPRLHTVCGWCGLLLQMSRRSVVCLFVWEKRQNRSWEQTGVSSGKYVLERGPSTPREEEFLRGK